MIQINGTITLPAGSLDLGRELLVSMAIKSRAEDGCIIYAFTQDLADPDTLYLIEQWRDQAALDAHMQSPHMAEFQKAMAQMPPREMNIRKYETDDGEPLG